MSNTSSAWMVRSLLWAAIILLTAAFLSRFTTLGAGASFGIVAGLSGAAYGAIMGQRRACASGHRQ